MFLWLGVNSDRTRLCNRASNTRVLSGGTRTEGYTFSFLVAPVSQFCGFGLPANRRIGGMAQSLVGGTIIFMLGFWFCVFITLTSAVARTPHVVLASTRVLIKKN
jgi:hypothetical protein